MSNELFIVTANDCAHCQTFRKSHLSTIVNTFTTSPKYKDITTREIHVENMGKKIADHPEIDQYIGWYPTILYVKNKGQRNQSILIFNGEISPTGGVIFRSKHPFNPQNIDKWLTDVHINKIMPQPSSTTDTSQQQQKSSQATSQASQSQAVLHPHVSDTNKYQAPSSCLFTFKIKPKH